VVVVFGDCLAGLVFVDRIDFEFFVVAFELYGWFFWYVDDVVYVVGCWCFGVL